MGGRRVGGGCYNYVYIHEKKDCLLLHIRQKNNCDRNLPETAWCDGQIRTSHTVLAASSITGQVRHALYTVCRYIHGVYM